MFFRQNDNSLMECLNKIIVGSLHVMDEFFFGSSGRKIAFSAFRANALRADVWFRASVILPENDFYAQECVSGFKNERRQVSTINFSRG